MRPWQLDAEFLQGHFRDLRNAAVVLGKHENRIRKLPPRSSIVKPTIGDDRHQFWPSDVKRLEQAVKRAGKPYGRYVLMILQTLSLPRPALICATFAANRDSIVNMCRRCSRPSVRPISYRRAAGGIDLDQPHRSLPGAIAIWC
jgi:hypothetical protein